MEEQLMNELNAIKLSIFNKSGLIDQLIIKMFSNQDISLGEILLKTNESIKKIKALFIEKSNLDSKLIVLINKYNKLEAINNENNNKISELESNTF